jgi:cell division septum initiation protein DivIVA
MTDYDLKRMNRGDLVEIIYQYQSREQEYTKKIDELTAQLEERKIKIDALTAQLEERRIKIEKAGSIAEAALSLNHIFETAQTAADQYTEEVRASNARKEAQAQQALDEAKNKADLICQQAQSEYTAMLEKAKQECDAMYSKITELLKNYEELRSLLPEQITSH